MFSFVRPPHLNKPGSQPKLPKGRQTAVVFLVLLIAFSSLSLVALKPRPAQALFGVGDVSVTVGDIPRQIADIIGKIRTVALEGLKQLAWMSLNNAIDSYVQNLAYESAVYLATGDAGKKPLIWKQPLGKALQYAGDAVVGDFLDRLSTDILGKSLCQPIDPRFNFQLAILLEQAQKPPKPSCSWLGIKDALGQSWGNIRREGLRLSQLQLEDVIDFSNYFDSRSNNLGQLIEADRDLKRELKKRQQEELETQKIEGQIKSLRTLISEEVITPGSVIGDSISSIQQTATEKQIPAKETSDLKIVNILMRGLTTFSRTFLGEWTKTLFKKGLVQTTKTGPSDIVAGVDGLASARQYYSVLEKARFETDISIDVTSQLSNCPSDENAARWNNCRISSDLKQAIDQQITLKEALTSVKEGGAGLINPQSLFGYDRQGRQEPDWENGFPYSSLVIMRKYRIVPVTWELAALYIRDVMQVDDHGGNISWTIKQVMDCYQEPDDVATTADERLDNTLPINCRIDPQADCGVSPEKCINPFWHLVNPNWVFKSPDTKCYQEGPGPEIIHEEYVEAPRQSLVDFGTIDTVEQRLISRADDYCADERSCIKEDDEGNCLFFGHCVRERPIWHFEAESCPAQYNTCQKLTEVKTAYQSLADVPTTDVSYLTNTLEKCSINSVGCGWYSLLYDTTTGQWEGNQDLPIFGNEIGRADRVYFNARAEKCSASDAGCTMLYKPSDFASDIGSDENGDGIIDDLEKINDLIVKAQSDPNSDGSDFYFNKATIQTLHMKLAPAWLDCSPSNLNQPAECENYATSCRPEDLNCQFYSPVNGNPKIPGKHSSTDLCSADCVGFNVFREMPSWFTDAQDGLIDSLPQRPIVNTTFVPASAQTCQQTGCEKFTNLDEVAKGGEGIDYYTKIRQCVTPGTPGSSAYFTWEGSDTTGYQLKRWVMLTGNLGAPCTGVQPGAPNVCANTTACNPLLDGPSCRAFFDANGSKYYANIDLVIYAHDDCHPLRRAVDGMVYYGISSLSQSCQAKNLGCLEYRGPGANNIKLVFLDTFEPADTTVDNLTFGWYPGILSSESLLLNSYSLKISLANPSQKDISDRVVKNRWYTINFYAKSDLAGNLTISFENEGSGSSDLFPTANLTPEWQYYTLGPIELTHDAETSEMLKIAGDGYIDNIILRESPGTNLFIADSWDAALATQCSANNDFGCELYSVAGSPNLPLKSLSHVCAEKYVGCTAFINTQNSTVATIDYPNPTRQADYNTANDAPVPPPLPHPNRFLDNLTVAGDSPVLLVDDQAKYCSSQQQGCQLVGLPVFDRQTYDGAVDFVNDCPGGICLQPKIKDIRTVALINNPDAYISTLCQAPEQFCALYSTVAGSQLSYINPGARACEYRENVSTPNGLVTGWFQKGKNEPCYSPLGSTAPIYQTNNLNYEQWVGECPQAYDSCSLITDPEAGVQSESDYYLIHNSLNNALADCQEQGLVDREAGCRLFGDWSEFGSKPDLFSAQAYDAKISENGQPPRSNTDTSKNTANVLIKVKPDRICEEFLHCASSLVVKDKSGKDKKICLGIGRCREIDSKGKCIDGSAEILGYNDTASEIVLSNYQTPLTTSTRSIISQANWQTGLVKAGAIWPQKGIDGLYSYHEMKEIGSPMTIPNSNFEDPSNFNHRFSSWPDFLHLATPPPVKFLQHAKIVKRLGGISPWEGERMLSLQVQNTNNPTADSAFVTTSALPISDDLRMALSLYVNFDALVQPDKSGICTAGHINNIGDPCSNDNICALPKTGVCTTKTFGAKYCKNRIGNKYNECENDNMCQGGYCGGWRCEGGTNGGNWCNPNDGKANNTLQCQGFPCKFFGNIGGKKCTDGANYKLGQSCANDNDCAPTYGTCKEVGANFEIRFLQSDGVTVIDQVTVSTDLKKGGWQHVSVPFVIPKGNGDDFHIQLYLYDNAGTGQVRGSVQVDNVEVRAGLEISSSKVVASSCRLYAKSESLACDYTDLSNVTGAKIKTHKGWRGYCVETVPDQPSVCMNWWPVDVVQGDVNFFNAGEVIDMNYANDLYYCLHSTGDEGVGAKYPYQKTAGFLVSGKKGSSKWSLPGAVVGYLHGGFIGGIIGSLANNLITKHVDDRCPEDFSKDPRWIIQDCKAPLKDDPGACRYPHTIGGCVNGCSPDISGCSHEALVHNSSRNLAEKNLRKSMVETIIFSKTSPRAEYPNWAILNKDLEITNNTNAAKTINSRFTLQPGESAWYVKCNRENPPRGKNGAFCASSGDTLEIAVIWTADNYIKSYFWLMSDESGDTAESASWVASYMLRDVCQTIARVNTSYGAHTPWLARFENPQNDSSLFLNKPNQDRTPLGSLAPPTNKYLPYIANLDNDWLYTPMFAMSDSPTLYCGNQYLPQSCARSGSPYSCRYDCGQTQVCIAGEKSRLGSECQTNSDCVEDDNPTGTGVCGGFVANPPYTDVLLQSSSHYSFGTGINRLKQLFAKTYDIYGWDYGLEQYVLCNSSNAAAAPYTCAVPNFAGDMLMPKFPVVTKSWPIQPLNVNTTVLDEYDITGCGWDGTNGAVGYPTKFKYEDTFICDYGNFDVMSFGHAPEANALQVDEQSGGVIKLSSGQFASLSFYPNVDGNRQPLKGMKVDWGDGSPLQPNQNLINLAGQGLPITRYIFVHQYICDSNSSNWNATTRECTSVPRVQLRDNWNWCTGDVSFPKGVYACNDKEAWVEFSGQIIVSASALPVVPGPPPIIPPPITGD